MSQSICCKYIEFVLPPPFPTSPLPTKMKLFQPTAPSFPSNVSNVFAFAFSPVNTSIPLFPLLFHLLHLPSPSLIPICMTVCHDIMSVSCCHVIMSYNILQTKYDYHWIISIYKQLNIKQ
jgi:hypothetical protein